MVRKALLLVEDVLTLEGPVMVWNLLEMMHHMVTLRHMRLFYMLLDHLIALTDGQMPKSHPLPAVLRGVRRLAASPTTTVDPSHALASLLERAWTLNAEILFNHFDLGLFQLYGSVLWESCSIFLPAATFGATDQLFDQIETLKQSVGAAAVVTDIAKELSAGTLAEEDGMMRRLLAPRTDASPPRDYGMLRASSIAALRERGNSILAAGPGPNGDATILMRVLSWLVAVGILEVSPAVAERSGTAGCATTTRVSRFDACSVAYALNAIERIRAIVALGGYVEGETDPQVVRVMWLLQDALVAAGKYEEAQEVERDACRRVEKYMQDIPADSA